MSCGSLPFFHYHNKPVKIHLYRYLLSVYLNVCAYLASLTRSMICLMVCRRMMPELFWSVPASLGSLSMEDKWTELLHHINTRERKTINTGCAPIRHPCSVQLTTPINRAVKYGMIISIQETTSVRL